MATRIAEFSDKASYCQFAPTGRFQADDLLVNQRVTGANAFHSKNGTQERNKQQTGEQKS